MLLSKSNATLKVPCYSQSPLLLSKSHATMSKSLAELASLAVAWGRAGIWGTSGRHLEADVAAGLNLGRPDAGLARNCAKTTVFTVFELATPGFA